MKMDIFLPEGRQLIISKPFAHVLSSKERGARCDECFSSGESLLRCSACKLARYCSRSCQKAAWILHKEECRCLVRVAPKVPTDSVRLLYRILLKLQKHGGQKETEEALGERRSFKELLSHSSEIKSDAQRTEDFIQLGRTLTVYAGDSIQMPSASELLETFGKMVINSFSICDGEMQPVGVGLYLGASVMDHSCEANAVVVFQGTTACVHTVSPVPQNPSPAQVRISYIDQLSPWEDRQKELRSLYYFSCACRLCADPEYNSRMMASKCPNKDCNSPVYELEGNLQPCEGCKYSDYTATYRQQRELHLQKLSNLIPQLKESQLLGEHEDLLDQCENQLTASDGILHEGNALMTRVYEKAFDACIQLAEWKKALIYGEKLLHGYRLFYVKNHPNIGIHLMKMGKILLFICELTEAMTVLQQAEAILRITHGIEHYIYTDLSHLVVQCTEELRGHLTAS